MKAPYWGMFRAAIVLIAVCDVAVILPDGRALAMIRPVCPTLGQASRRSRGLAAIPPLRRMPTDGMATFRRRHSTPNFSADQTGAVAQNAAIAPTTTGQPSSIGPTNLPPVVIATTNTGGAPPRFAADQNLPLVASGPNSAQPTTPNSPVPAASQAPPAAKTVHSPWQPIQAAFRQFTDTKSDESAPAPAADVVPSRPNVRRARFDRSGIAGSQYSAITIDSRQQHATGAGRSDRHGCDHSTPGSMANAARRCAKCNRALPDCRPDSIRCSRRRSFMKASTARPAPGGCGCKWRWWWWLPEFARGASGLSQLRRLEALLDMHERSGRLDDLQRLACRLTRPRPDCSNGCVDFCDSWLFHENDWWATSNHKCPAAGCGPWPYGGCETDGKGKGNGCGCGNCGSVFRRRISILAPRRWHYGGITALETKTLFSLLPTRVRLQSPYPYLTLVHSTSIGALVRVFVLGYRPTPKDGLGIDVFRLAGF